MPNIWENSDVVAAKTLNHFDGNLVLAKTVDRQWESKFGVEGAKIGDHIDLRRHFNPTVRTGNQFTPQNIEDRVRRLTIDTPLGVDYEIPNADMSLSMDRAEERYFQPAGRRLANEVDSRIAALYKKVANFTGTYNTLPTALTDFNSCRARLTSFGVPQEDRHFVLDPTTGNAAVVSMSALFNNQQKVGKQYTSGTMGKNVLGADWDESQNIRAHTVGALGGTPLVDGVPTSGATTLAVKGWTATITDVVKEGDIFTIAGVNAVNTITGEDLGFLRQFVVTADASSDGSGNTTLSIDPPIISSGGFKTVSALPADSAALTMVTTAGGVTQACPMYFHKNWAALCIAPEPAMSGTGAKMKMISDPDGGGIGIRYAFWWDGDVNTWKIRFDINIGLLAQLPEFCLRLGTS